MAWWRCNVFRCCLPDYDINVEHTNIIRDKYIFLLDNIDTKYSTVIDELVSSRVLDERERDEITCQSSQYGQNEKLLSVLSRKSAQQFQLFVEALKNSGQGHVADNIVGM